MAGYKEIFGVDISRDVLDIVNTKTIHRQFSNDENGFREFEKYLTKDDLVVMEATGYYHYCLAQYLYKKGYFISVVNPLSVKRFIQMKLSKIKTDKSDAKAICEYAIINNVPLYSAKSKSQAECIQLLSLTDVYLKQTTAIKNKIHGENTLGIPSKFVLRSLHRSLKHLQKEIINLEERLIKIVEKQHRKKHELLKTIPGLGTKTSLLLLVLTDGFSRFENAKQLCSFTGITPVIRKSGTSVNKRSKISKIGNKKLRNLLFLCSFSACKYNRYCKELFDRIVAKGKSKKLALIAVSNKLLKQAFAIANSGIPYKNDYVSKLV
jgi:transposase